MNSVTLSKTLVPLFVASILWGCSPSSETSDNSNPTLSQSESQASWKLIPEESGMTYITIHNGNVAEINTFRKITGGVKADGTAELRIDLDSVDTNHDVRNERLKTVLFKTVDFPEAVITSNIEMSDLESLKKGQSHTLLLDMEISLHGITLKRNFYVLATRLDENKVVVTNKAPLILQAEDFGFTRGIEELRSLAGLDQITPLVTATVSFTFAR